MKNKNNNKVKRCKCMTRYNHLCHYIAVIDGMCMLHYNQKLKKKNETIKNVNVYK